MTTTTSSFKGSHFWGLYKSNFKRGLGYFGLFSALIFLFYPVQYLLEISRDPRGDLGTTHLEPLTIGLFDLMGPAKSFTPLAVFIFSGLMVLLPLLLALILNSYMHSKKAADVYHALPVSREALLTANLAVAMSYLAIPVVVSGVIIATAQTARFGFLPHLLGNLALDTLGWLACAFTIYAIATFVAVLCGTVFDNFILSCELLCAGPAITGLFTLMASLYLYGYEVTEDTGFYILNTTPTMIMPVREILFSAMGYSSFENAHYYTRSNWMLLTWLLIGVVLFFLALRIYRKRHSERAETTTSRGILPLISQFIAILVVSCLMGLLFSSLLRSSLLWRDDFTFLAWAAIGGVLTFLILEAILNRGFKTILKRLPLGVGMIAISLCSFALVMNGWFGFETRVPAAQKVTSVELSYPNKSSNSVSSLAASEEVTQVFTNPTPDDLVITRLSYTDKPLQLTDSENIQAVLAFHQNIVEDYQKAPSDIERITEDFSNEDTSLYGTIRLTYHLKNGGKLVRSYHEASLAAYEELVPLEVSQEFLEQTSPVFFTDPSWIGEWNLSDMFYSTTQTLHLSQDDSKLLLEAIRQDQLSLTEEDLRAPSEKAVAELSFTCNNPPEYRLEQFSYVSTYLVADGGKTAQFLRQKGYLDAIEPDMEEFSGVILEPLLQFNEPPAIVRQQDFYSYTNTYETFTEALAQISKAQEYLEEYPGMIDSFNYERYGISVDTEELSQYFGENTQEIVDEFLDEGLINDVNKVVIQDFESMRALSKLVVCTWDQKDPLVQATFYLDDNKAGDYKTVFIPYNTLPEDLKLQLVPAGSQSNFPLPATNTAQS